MGVAFSHAHAASLCVQLPRTGRVYTAINPDLAYDERMQLLRQIEYDLRVLAWQQTEDARHRRNAPDPIPLPSERVEPSHDQVMRDKAFVDSILGR
ncbi:MAG TPA: hypothetical protein DEV22_03260 [Collinsella sp.]|uniref:hypothetical protein n=1 Tax=uncultured Bifidobacterium sp. TaxID=165187 RepID=UPI000ED0D0ED|nr:hypothetical protein [uncultured Bifidobacterium sp.]HCG61420.1 hypothetical protein [Collinsella sp.]